jgi:enoyl-[acyl-carrier protein] reductase II
LGAEGIAMGTRLMTTKESPLHDNYKKMTLENQVYDTLFSKRFDGILCRVMKTDAAKRALKKGLNLPAAFFNSREIAKQVNVPYFKLFVGVLASGWSNARQLAFMANAFQAIKEATEDGNTKTGVLPVGQVQGLISDQPTVAQLFERMVKEAQAAQAKVNAALS